MRYRLSDYKQRDALIYIANNLDINSERPRYTTWKVYS